MLSSRQYLDLTRYDTLCCPVRSFVLVSLHDYIKYETNQGSEHLFSLTKRPFNVQLCLSFPKRTSLQDPSGSATSGRPDLPLTARSHCSLQCESLPTDPLPNLSTGMLQCMHIKIHTPDTEYTHAETYLLYGLNVVANI